MPVIVVKAFSGMRPIVEPHLLDPSEAVTAQNVKLSSGGLVPLRAVTGMRALNLAAPQTIWRYGSSSNEQDWWFEAAGDVDFMRSPIVADQWNRAYWTDGVAPRYGPNNMLLSGSGALPGASYLLGVPAPATAPTLTFTPSAAATSEARLYVYTYVSSFGEEGPPSPPSAQANLDPTQPVTVAGMATGPGGSYSIATKRIYRTSTVGSTAQFQFVAEIPVATTSYSDSISQASLGEVLPSTDWDPPPTGLRGLKLLANGSAIGFVGNTVHLSEPFLPHAWPYETPVEHPVVGVGVFRDSAAILTNSFPYIMSGADPAAMTPVRLELPQACLSKRSIVDTGDGTMYASTDGLCSIGPGGIEVVTRRLMSRDQWQSYNPPSMQGAFHDGKYHCLYTTTGGVRGMLIFNFTGTGGALTLSDINAATAASAVYADPRSDTLYMAQGTSIVRFDRGAALSMLWRSGTYRMPQPCNMACMQVDAEAYPLTARVYANGVLVHTQSVLNRFAFRLPAGFEAIDWSFDLQSTARVTRATLATSISELRSAS